MGNANPLNDISRVRPEHPRKPITPIFGRKGGIADVVIQSKFLAIDSGDLLPEVVEYLSFSTLIQQVWATDQPVILGG